MQRIDSFPLWLDFFVLATWVFFFRSSMEHSLAFYGGSRVSRVDNGRGLIGAGGSLVPRAALLIYRAGTVLG